MKVQTPHSAGQTAGGIVVILNPAARGEKARKLCEKVEQLARHECVQTTAGRGEARAMAEWAVKHGYTTVVAAGGDGTINEIVNGIAGADVTLGLLPMGTMNVFATELGLPVNNLRKCWEIIEAGRTRRIDLVQADEHYVVQLAGIGLDAQVVKETSWDFKKTFGPLSYV